MKLERTNQTNFVLSSAKICLSRDRFHAQWNDSKLLTCAVTLSNMCKGRFQYAVSISRTHPSQSCKGDTVRISDLTRSLSFQVFDYPAVYYPALFNYAPRAPREVYNVVASRYLSHFSPALCSQYFTFMVLRGGPWKSPDDFARSERRSA